MLVRDGNNTQRNQKFKIHRRNYIPNNSKKEKQKKKEMMTVSQLYERQSKTTLKVGGLTRRHLAPVLESPQYLLLCLCCAELGAANLVVISRHTLRTLRDIRGGDCLGRLRQGC